MEQIQSWKGKGLFYSFTAAAGAVPLRLTCQLDTRI